MKNRVACATPLQEMAPSVPKSAALGQRPWREARGMVERSHVHGIVRLEAYPAFARLLHRNDSTICHSA